KPDFKKRKITVPIEDYFHKKHESEDRKLRYETYNLMWQQMKSVTEVNIYYFSNTNTIDLLVIALHNNVTPYVVLLQAKECPDLKHFLQRFASQLMDCCVDIKPKEEANVKVTQKKTYYSVDSLSSWYMTVTQKTDPKMPSKKRTTSGQWQSPPVVLILKDMESFTTKVLQDFIIISSQHLHEFPLILIFGIATSPVIIHRLLPHAVSSLLCIELFQSLSCKEHLTTVLDKMLVINLFMSQKHFYSQPLSVLCCDLPEAKKRIKFLSVNQCENIRRLPSFRRYVEQQTPEKQVALLTNETCLKEETQSLLENLHVYHMKYFLILRCLHNFTSSLPKYPLGRQIRELYSTCLEKNVWESEEYASALQLLRLMLAKDELITILEKCFEVLNSSSEKQLGSTIKKIEDFLSQFQNLDEDAKEEEDASGSQPKGLQKTDLYHLQKSLLEMKELRRTTKKQTKFEALREKVVNFIDCLVRDYLLPPESQPLHEVLYFSAAHTLREHLNAAPRIALHTALNNPYYYLKNEALKSEEGCIPNVAPDVCVAYKLHLECSRLINLADWSEAFATVVTAAEKMDASSTTSEEMSEIIHARFIRAVSELELLGFIKSTKQKTDHVARLTWGGC
uniref:Origin recognition complex subunit 3 n=1 Tax=Nannospalax galili TaxID=1026970 RepID=A0A8C6WDQ3_NANGA